MCRARHLGHTISTGAQSSGVDPIAPVHVNGAPALQGGTDPRREGVALGGETFVP